LVDPIAASRLAGIAYESFPSLVWGETDGETMEILVDTLESGYLKPRRGRVWSLLWEPNGTERDKCRVASMLTGQFYGLDETTGWVADDALAGQMGQPLGELEWADLPDGSRIYTRRFAGGEAMMEIAPNGGTVWGGFQEN